MNLLLCHAEELEAGRRLVLRDGRAEHCLAVLKVALGDVVRLGVVDGSIGEGRVTASGPGWLELEAHLGPPPAPPPPLDLIVALPRPIMLQRILKQVAVFGVRRLLLVNSGRVEKSFWQSKVLAPERTRALLLEGLAQAGVDTRLPRVSRHRSFKRCVTEDLAVVSPSIRLVAHPEATRSMAELRGRMTLGTPVLLAVGPEGGWLAPEVESLLAQGFTPVSLGPRILHVDTAVVSLLSRIALLREMSL